MADKRIRELLSYDEQTGVLTWRIATANSFKVGDEAGHLTRNGYIRVRILGRDIMAHRLAWFLATGAWPENEIDHIDGVRSNNRFENLRPATRNLNQQNIRRAKAGNRLGLLGVSRNGSGFQARIRADGSSRCLGTFPTPELAHDAYLRAKRELHPGGTI